MTKEELKAHFEKVRRCEVRPMSEAERTEYLFRRWDGLLRRLAESEREDRELAPPSERA